MGAFVGEREEAKIQMCAVLVFGDWKILMGGH